MQKIVGDMGRVVLPVDQRKCLGLEIGSTCNIELDREKKRIIITNPNYNKYDINEYIRYQRARFGNCQDITKEMVIEAFDNIINEIDKNN